MSYSRPQLKLLVFLAAILLPGLCVHEWRAGCPDAAERLDRFDCEDPPSPFRACHGRLAPKGSTRLRHAFETSQS